jgi:hypothetical protein
VSLRMLPHWNGHIPMLLYVDHSLSAPNLIMLLLFK